MNDYDDFPESPEDYHESGYATDHYYQEAQEEIRDLFERNKEGAYYLREPLIITTLSLPPRSTTG
jgi:hypothetical protein